MIARIDLTGKQLATINSRPNVYRHAGAQLMGKQIIGSESHLKALRKELKGWIEESGEVTLEMDLQPIIDQIDEALK
ncbi:MAG TPA: hypothetical protein VKA06_10450 [Spirochaetia bacterium]|nr:hypothetical protein [Spirochaetia bacterium]